MDLPAESVRDRLERQMTVLLILFAIGSAYSHLRVRPGRNLRGPAPYFGFAFTTLNQPCSGLQPECWNALTGPIHLGPTGPSSWNSRSVAVARSGQR